MCVDRDDAGDKTVKRIGDELNEMGYEWERILPENKDWNEDLRHNRLEPHAVQEGKFVAIMR